MSQQNIPSTVIESKDEAWESNETAKNEKEVKKILEKSPAYGVKPIKKKRINHSFSDDILSKQASVEEAVNQSYRVINDMKKWLPPVAAKQGKQKSWMERQFREYENQTNRMKGVRSGWQTKSPVPLDPEWGFTNVSGEGMMDESLTR